ncbi:nuclear matrix constituent protein 1-like protein [Dorcoceras hygrometricum]|uniref:Nuclear matrix constituent protein 1-like protein n=1 Tax=Dorcoceras hygrometricum TaxID=472368 RepID=A0A2Z7AX33_9LAMI|nr:nuclear matrix constituent protein 1-like protein [Dorcoceras hygrometricum]
MVQIDGMWTPIQGPEFWRSSCKLSLFVNKRQVPESVVEEDFVPHGCLIEPFQYWGVAPSLIKTWGWARVCTEVIRYGMFGCLRPVCKEIVVYNLGVERIPDYILSAFQKGVCTDTFVGYFSGSSVQTESEIELSSSDGDTVYRSPSPILQKADTQEELLYIVESPESPPSIPQRQESSSSSSDSQMLFDSNDFPLDDTTEAQTSLPAATVDLSSLLDDLKSSLSQRMDDAHCEILSRLHSTERSLQTSLGHQNDYLRSLIQSARQEGQIQDDVQNLRLNELKKAVIAQGVSADTESLAIRNKFNALDAKILLLDGQVAAIRSEQLEFQAKIAADLLSLSTQIGDLVDYIRGGDAKKGEGISSRPQPPSNVQGQGSGGNPGEGSGPSVVRLTDIADRIREDDRRQMEAERERERQRRIRRLSSGSHKRRRGY